MKASSTKNRDKYLSVFYICLLIIIWHITSLAIGQEILLVSPISVGKRFFELSFNPKFWLAIWVSFTHILLGFVTAFIFGISLGTLSYISKHVRCFITPIIGVIKSTPVVSFIILALVYISTSMLPTFISFLMVFPIFWTNTFKGLSGADKELIEMSEIFNVSLKKQLKHIYLPTVIPYISSAASLGIGYAWKSGIAAEVIGLSKNSIGLSLYDAKLYLATADMMCYTIAIIIISIINEKLIKYFMSKVSSRILG